MLTQPQKEPGSWQVCTTWLGELDGEVGWGLFSWTFRGVCASPDFLLGPPPPSPRLWMTIQGAASLQERCEVWAVLFQTTFFLNVIPSHARHGDSGPTKRGRQTSLERRPSTGTAEGSGLVSAWPLFLMCCVCPEVSLTLPPHPQSDEGVTPIPQIPASPLSPL